MTAGPRCTQSRRWSRIGLFIPSSLSQNHCTGLPKEVFCCFQKNLLRGPSLPCAEQSMKVSQKLVQPYWNEEPQTVPSYPHKSSKLTQKNYYSFARNSHARLERLRECSQFDLAAPRGSRGNVGAVRNKLLGTEHVAGVGVTEEWEVIVAVRSQLVSCG